MSMSLSVVCLTGASLVNIGAAIYRLRKEPSAYPGMLYLVASALLAILLAERWVSLGQGPFISMYEVLVSSLFSLSLIFGVSYIVSPVARTGAPAATLVLLIMGAWAMVSDPGKIPLPATYGNPWLWVHVLFGKLFLGTVLVASGIAMMQFVRIRRPEVADSVALRAAWRWLSMALVFHTGMLISGAVWAQDAWGRYWGWDPLETWAFATWLWMVLIIHARASYTLRPTVQQVLLVGAFVIAFLTFFGIPFISLSPHKGAV